MLDSWRSILRIVTIAGALVAISGSSLTAVAREEETGQRRPRPNIVLVHGAWADGSSWSAVIQRLQKAGYNVIAPQFPLTTLADNVARLRQVFDGPDRPHPSWWVTPTADRSSPRTRHRRAERGGAWCTSRPLGSTSGRIDWWIAFTGSAYPSAGTLAHRRAGLRLAARNPISCSTSHPTSIASRPT